MQFTCNPMQKMPQFQASLHFKIAIRPILVNKPGSIALILRKLVPSCLVWQLFCSSLVWMSASVLSVNPSSALLFFCRFHLSPLWSHHHLLSILQHVLYCLFPQAQCCCWLLSRCSSTGLEEGGSAWTGFQQPGSTGHWKGPAVWVA